MAGFSRDELIDIYRKRAKHYDLYDKFFQLIGFPHRKRAIQALNLQRGDTVVEIGCGTGLNFPLLQEAIGPQGMIIGVDLTDAMLDQARQRVQAHSWRNVRLVHSDAATFTFPADVAGIISTFALTLVPEFDRVILNGCRALKPGKRWAITDLKMPSNALLVKLVVPLLEVTLLRPFGGTVEMANRHPWESMQKYLQNVEMSEYWGGMIYIAVGERGETGG
jgi:demethylmenaquinone methyltransferase/2-methoxy-6-polyprenyl-1,4-benzoquinol methylase